MVTSCPLTSALAGQTASKWGEKNPTVDTGTNYFHLFLPCVYNQNVSFCTKYSDTVLVVSVWWWRVSMSTHVGPSALWLFGFLCCSPDGSPSTGCFLWKQIQCHPGVNRNFLTFMVFHNLFCISDYITFFLMHSLSVEYTSFLKNDKYDII